MTKSLLTDAKIKGLKPGEKGRTEYADSVVDGLRIRVSSRAKIWILRARAAGRVRTFTIGEFGDRDGQVGLAAARTEAVAMKGSIKAGVIPKPRVHLRRGDGHTVAQMINRFMNGYVPDRKIKRPQNYRWMFDKYIVPKIGDDDVRQLARKDLRAVVQQVRDENGLTSARRVGGLIKRLFGWLASEDILEVDVAAPMKLPGAEVQRDRILTEKEIRAFWDATDPDRRPAVLNKAGRPKVFASDYPWGSYFRLLLLLGQRRGEVAHMRWSAIDLKKGTWTLEASEVKSKRAHIVPLAPMALTIIEAIPRILYADENGTARESDWILTTNGKAPIADFGKPKRWLDEAMVKELRQLPAWVVHDLRRTVSTNLARLGIDPFVRRRVLNHALTGVDAIYDRYDYLEPKRQALEKWETDLARIVASSHPI